MKKLFLVSLIYSGSFLIMNAQVHWSGLIPGNIYYDQGWVGIGTTSITSPLTISNPTTHLIPTVQVIHTSANPGCAGCFNIGQRITVSDDQGTWKSNIGLWINTVNAQNNYAAIFENGNVGIGTTTPVTSLHVYQNASAGTVLTVEGGSNNVDYTAARILLKTASTYRGAGIHIYNTGANWYSGTPYTSADRFIVSRLAGAEDQAVATLANALLTIDNTGNVGIGTIDPAGHKLFINSDQGTINNSALKIIYNGETNVLGEVAMLAHRNSQWSGLYINGTGSSLTNALYIEGNKPVIFNGGDVGIGTTTPQGKLHISNGDLILQNETSGYPVLWLKDVAGNNILRVDYNSLTHDGDNLYIRSNQDHLLVLNDSGGNVLIGKNTQINSAYKLDVSGKIRADEVVVNTTGADFVFEPDYKLPKLSEIEKYIRENKRLPDFASASEMKENGLNVSEMQTKLLQKIEELTLYTVEQNKKIEEQNEKINALENKIERIESASNNYLNSK